MKLRGIFILFLISNLFLNTFVNASVLDSASKKIDQEQVSSSAIKKHVIPKIKPEVQILEHKTHKKHTEESKERAHNNSIIFDVSSSISINEKGQVFIAAYNFKRKLLGFFIWEDNKHQYLGSILLNDSYGFSPTIFSGYYNDNKLCFAANNNESKLFIYKKEKLYFNRIELVTGSNFVTNSNCDMWTGDDQGNLHHFNHEGFIRKISTGRRNAYTYGINAVGNVIATVADKFTYKSSTDSFALIDDNSLILIPNNYGKGTFHPIDINDKKDILGRLYLEGEISVAILKSDNQMLISKPAPLSNYNLHAAAINNHGQVIVCGHQEILGYVVINC